MRQELSVVQQVPTEPRKGRRPETWYELYMNLIVLFFGLPLLFFILWFESFFFGRDSSA